MNNFAGYYNVYKYAKYGVNKMNFKLDDDDDDDSLDKIYDTFEHIGEKLGIDLESCFL